MKIWNIKMNLGILLWIVIGIVGIILILLFLSRNTALNMNNENYTQILRDTHQNIARYLGKTVTTSGYIFRGKDFVSQHFVIARDMLISETEANIVGFLCTYPLANDFENNEWVEATGIITLGDYYGPIPLLKIETIHKITTPNDVFVYPPK